MNRFNPYPEFHALLREAVETLGEKRVALGAGCDLSSIPSWLRRPSVELSMKTINQTLPRLRQWQSWVPGYLAAQAEIRELEVDAMACWKNCAEELRTRLEDAAEQYSMRDLALACEVPEKRLLMWRLGLCLDRFTDDLARALGHLRHIDGWPGSTTQPEDEVTQAPEVVASAVTAAGRA